MKKNLNAFLPKLLRKILIDNSETSLKAKVFALHGGCLFADVSGFTVMSEKLAAIGREGAEELTRILNMFYGSMVTEIQRWNGDIIKFAGDAITVFYNDTDGLDRALKCSLHMQNLMTNFSNFITPLGSFSLKMKIGVAGGNCIGSVVGDGNNADFLFAGSIVDESADAEHHAEAGDIVLCEEGGANFRKITGKLTEPDFSPEPEILLPERKIHRFLPDELLKKLAQEGRSYTNEHRRVVVLFISFSLAKGDSGYDDIDWLHKFYLISLRISKQYDGYINKIDMGDKGAKIIVLFGAPIAHENDADRAFLTAIEITKAASQAGIQTKIGINYAPIFAGIVGSEQRCEYTVMGDGVNLAARLMSATNHGEVMCHSSVREAAKDNFDFLEKAPIMVKGKKDPQEVLVLIKKVETTQLNTAKQEQFINRETEIQKTNDYLLKDHSGLPHLINLSGEQGVGKTAFISHVFNNFPEELIFFVGVAHDYTKNTSYYVFKPILRELIEIIALEGQQLTEAFLSVLKENSPQLLPYATLLGNLIGEEELAATVIQLDDDSKKNILWKIIRVIIEEVSKIKKIVFIIDNCQWLDELSSELLQNLILSVETQNVDFVISGREINTAFNDLVPALQIKLKPFSEREADVFACRYLGVREIPDKVLARLMERSKGVPLVMQEVIHSFIESGFIERSSQYNDLLLVNELKLADIPETLDGMVMSRFDKLSSQNKQFLKMISVFGEEMPYHLITAVIEDSHFSLKVKEEQPELHSFISIDKDESNIRFVQPYFRTIIYESIDFATRRELHRKLGNICEQIFANDYIYRNEILAYHYSKGDDAEAAIPFLSIVVAKSISNNAYSVAVEQLERLILFERKVGKTLKLIKHQLQLTEIFIKLAEFNKVNNLLKELKMTEQLTPLQLATVYFFSGNIAQLQGNFEEAIASFNLCIKITDNELITLQALRTKGTILAQRGEFNAAKHHFEKLRRKYISLKGYSEYASTLLNLGMTLFFTGKTDMHLFNEAIKTYRGNGDILNEMKVLNNLGQIEERKGAYNKSLNYYLKASKRASQFGFNNVLNMTLSNVGLAHFNLLNIEAARSYYEKALSYGNKFNKGSMNVLITQVNLAEVMSYLAQYAQAMDLYNQAVEVASKFGQIELDVIVEYALFLYRFNYSSKLKLLHQKLESASRVKMIPQIKIAILFFKAIINENNYEDLMKKAETYALENNLHKFAFLATYGLFVKNLNSDNLKTKYYLDKLLLLKTKKTSFSTIMIELCNIRFNYEKKRIEKIDKLFKQHPWPDISWKRHLWIGETYLKVGKKAAARKRFKRASEETKKIGDNIKNNTLLEIFTSNPDYLKLKKHLMYKL